MEDKFIIATHNQYKLTQIQNILQFFGRDGESYLTRLPLQQFPPETTTSYQANVRQKALFISQQLPTAQVIADDSGLELAAFPGRYGVKTARELAQEAPNGHLTDYLLRLVDGHSRHFVMKSLVVLASNKQVLALGKGELRGTIAETKRGHNSTGFDRIFIPKGASQTLAEMDLTKRMNYFHRARALKNLLDQLNPPQANS